MCVMCAGYYRSRRAVFSMEQPSTDNACCAKSIDRRSVNLLLVNARNGLRLAFFQPARCFIPCDWLQITAFALATLAIPLLYDFYVLGRQGQFAWNALPAALVHLPLLTFAALVLAKTFARDETVLSLLQIFLMITAAIDAVVYVISTITYDANLERALAVLQYDNGVVPTVWLTLACSKAAADLMIGSGMRRVIPYALGGVILVLPLTQIDRERSPWQEVNEHEIAQNTELLNEDALYDQPAILDREIGAVKAGRPGVSDLFFLGVAGYGAQDVFMKEIDAVSRIFKERFHTQDKTIRLINNRKTLSEVPIASIRSLRASLRAISRVMDQDEDILFLFLTSHGLRSHQLSLDLWPMRLRQLDPATLRSLLDESGIKNRVIVISACFSGGFVDALKNADTLVISSSAPDKSSFGCSNDADWTYFGKAYFAEGLRSTYSFVQAFERALPVIAAREREEGYTPSDPHISVGAAIEEKLLKLERQLTR